MARKLGLVCASALGLAFFLALAPCCQAQALPVAQCRPAPDHWEQWRPDRQPADDRLHDTTVSVWEPCVTVADLLGAISEASSVELTTGDDLRPFRVTAFAQHFPLGEVMVSLASLFDGHWLFDPTQPPEARVYCLLPPDSLSEPMDQWETQRWRALKRARAAPHRAAREQRLALYQRALPLTAPQLLQQYEADDPWLCADLLWPAFRPMIAQICALTHSQKEQFLADGELQLPLSSFEPDFQHHLAHWVKGRWGRTGMAQFRPDPDQLLRFPTPEQRWEHSVVRLWWHTTGLRFQLDVPDVARFDADAIHFAHDSRRQARRRLISLGYREDTPEYRAAGDRDAAAWARPGGGQPSANANDDLPYQPFVPDPDHTDPHLAATIEVTAVEAETLSASDVLGQAARQCGIGIVSHYLPPHYYARPGPSSGAERTTLADLLDDIRRHRGGAWSWRFHGDQLIATDAEYRLLEASRLPDDIISQCRDVLRPGTSTPLDDLASLLAPLNSAQIGALIDALPDIDQFPLYGLRLYGSFDSEQRDGLNHPRGLPFHHLRPHQQRLVFDIARRSRPWLHLTAMQQAVMRALPRTLSTGEPALSLVIEYHFPRSPTDRDIIFTCPLAIFILPNSTIP